MPDKQFPSCFPSDFEEKILPPNLLPLKIVVFRVCTTDTICKDSFLSTFEATLSGKRREPPNWKEQLRDPGVYSVSCNDSEKDALNVLKCLTRYYPDPFIMKGTASSELGPMQYTVERDPQYKFKSHIDWWLYADSDPSPGFEMVPIPQNEQEKQPVPV